MVTLNLPVEVVETSDQRRDGFPFRSGSVVLDFVATVAKRDLADRELLTDAESFTRWIYVAGLPVITECVTESDLYAVRVLREALYRLTRARALGGPIDNADIEIVNSSAAPAPPIPLLDASGSGLIPAVGVDAASIRSLLARDAIELFTGAYRNRIRLCRGHECSLYFVDRSRLGNRTWCAMSVCGAKQSSARYRARQRTTRPDNTAR